MSDMDAYRDVFLAESGDYLQQITDGLLALERESGDLAPVEVIFRGAHSLKGMSAAMGYERTADLTHKMEGLMDRVRREEIAVSRQLVDLMLASVDLARDLIDDESNGGSSVDPSATIAALVEATERGFADAEIVPELATEAEMADLAEKSREAVAAGNNIWRVTVTLEPECVLKAVRAYMVIKRLSHMGEVLDTEPSTRDIEDENFDYSFVILVATRANEVAVKDAVLFVSEVAEAAIEAVAVEPEPVAVVEELDAAAKPARARSRELPKISETQTVRVAIGHLDTLVNLVGELVILRSKLERIASERYTPELSEVVDDLQTISAEMQYEVMQTRMVPVGNIFNRFPRMVRDLAADLGKQVEFDIEGLDIELDRTVLDEIGDPIVHLLRNSIDHGIEDAERRVEVGKPATGSIRLTASRERDHVAIIVSDDGKGIDPERLWSVAVKRGLVTPELRADYSTSDILQLICLPGFSTAEKATKVSGRGVGMDVVKGKIEHLGGTLQIHSRVGQGTDFILRLPLTLAIVKALLVRCCDQVFALPLSAVDEVIAVEELALDTIDQSPVVVLRDGSVAPVWRLDTLLYGAPRDLVPEPRSNVVLMGLGDSAVALHVGEVVGRREIVVKPLSRLFRDMKGFSGATILGDGRVVLILDPRTIFSIPEATR